MLYGMASFLPQMFSVYEKLKRNEQLDKLDEFEFFVSKIYLFKFQYSTKFWTFADDCFCCG